MLPPATTARNGRHLRHPNTTVATAASGRRRVRTL